jgi:DNA uptake protein ComE-like DNA-binding protein
MGLFLAYPDQPANLRTHPMLWSFRMRTISFRRLVGIALVVALTWVLLGCTNHSPNEQELRQKSAQATREARQGAKQLASDGKAAAANAVKGVNAVAQGIKDGVSSNKSDDSSNRVDINSASTARLAMLPGIGIRKAREIAKGRPYRDTHSLVSQGLLTEAEYNRIADKVTAK